MMAVLKLQYLVIIGVCLHLRFSHGSPLRLPCDGVKIVTYGEPCHSPSYLPIKIEEPVVPVEECIPTQIYQPLKINYQISKPIPQPTYINAEYPVSVEVPKVIPSTTCVTDLFQGKSYGYSIQIPPPPPTPIAAAYNCDLQVIPPTPTIVTPERPVELLTGLTSKIDTILVPACEERCSCSAYTA